MLFLAYTFLVYRIIVSIPSILNAVFCPAEDGDNACNNDTRQKPTHPLTTLLSSIIGRALVVSIIFILAPFVLLFMYKSILQIKYDIIREYLTNSVKITIVEKNIKNPIK
jgi:hypothetical protein